MVNLNRELVEIKFVLRGRIVNKCSRLLYCNSEQICDEKSVLFYIIVRKYDPKEYAI